MTVCNLLTATGLYMVITKLWPIIKHIIPLKHRWAILLPPTLRLQPLSSNYCYVTGKWIWKEQWGMPKVTIPYCLKK